MAYLSLLSIKNIKPMKKCKSPKSSLARWSGYQVKGIVHLRGGNTGGEGEGEGGTEVDPGGGGGPTEIPDPVV